MRSRSPRASSAPQWSRSSSSAAGNEAQARCVFTGMRTLQEIHSEIDRESERRIELWHLLSETHDPTLRAELKQLEARLDHLWDEHRAARAEIRWGERERIVARARQEERLERAA